jgi:anti-sigma28 factor (negative regulator of flagellin synthesis)
MAKEETPKSNSQYSIVRAIVTLFKLGEEGKVENFFARQRRAMSREVATLQKEMDLNKFNHEQALEDVDDKIADAKEAIENAYLQVDASKITNNADADRFADGYWDRVLAAEAHLKTLEEEKETLVEEYEEQLDENKQEIAERKRRVSKISAEK